MMYFAHCATLDDLKASYRKLAFQHHPDRGGDTRTMQDINAEYAAVLERMRAGAWIGQEGRRNVKSDGTSYSTKDYDEAAELARMIERLVALGLSVELCGTWLWVSGDTRPRKEELKKLGCRWAPKKKLWYWRPPSQKFYRRRGKGETDMEEIRSKYGSKVYA